MGGAGTILRTTNSGINWISQTSGTTDWLPDVFFTDVNNGTAVGGYYGVSTILRTTNGGTNWISQYSGTNERLYGVSFTDVNTGTAVGINGTILRTTNGGTNWILQTSGTINHLKGVSFTDANNGTAVGQNGTILRTTKGGVFVNQISSKIPERISLYQNYPNPFNPTTKIRFGLKQSSNTKLIIYNILGKEITTLVNEKLNAGSYEVDWDGSNYPSGVYFYRLSADGNVVDTRKMMLIK